MLQSVAHDMGQALRSLARAPGLALLAALTLGAGVGSTAAIFSVVDAVLIRPLPYPESDRLTVLHRASEGRRTLNNHSEPEFLDYEGEVASFGEVAAYADIDLGLGSGAEPELLTAVRATASLFPLLGVEPHLGRVFTAAEDVPDGSPVVVLSHALWVRAFGADPGVVGRSIRIDASACTVVGVMPAGFDFPRTGTKAWVPLSVDRANPWGRGNSYLSVVARLAPGVGLETARAELDALAARSTRLYPEVYATPVSFLAYGLLDQIVGDVRTALLLLLGAVAGVLLIASVNAAALLLARGELRRGEVAIRMALGAGRLRVATQFMGESLLVALVAAVAAAALAYGGVVALRALAPPDLPRLEEVTVNARVLAFGLGISLVTGLLFGLAPALQALRRDMRDVLGVGAWGAIGSRRAERFRRGLVVTQLALATMLTLGAGLLVGSFQALRQVELGFDPAGVLVVPLHPPESEVPEDAAAVVFYQTLGARLAALPGVTAAGSSLRLPLAEGHDYYSLQVEGRLVSNAGDASVPGMQWATPGYFAALGIPLRQGRLFTEADRADAPLVAVVNERLAAELWPGESPLGKRLRMFPDGNPWIEIIGVVADVKHYGIQGKPSTKLYIPHAQGYLSAYYSPNRMNVIVRTDADPSALAGPVRELLREVGPGIPLGTVRTMDQVVSRTLARDRFTLLLLGAFAGVALLLASVGVYGVIAGAVAARTREIGLRMAVGADRAAIATSVLREGLILATMGCSIGLVGGLALSGLLRSLLFGVSPTDPWTFAVVVPVLGLAGALASLVPAVSASRVDPVKALRAD